MTWKWLTVRFKQVIYFRQQQQQPQQQQQQQHLLTAASLVSHSSAYTNWGECKHGSDGWHFRQLCFVISCGSTAQRPVNIFQTCFFFFFFLVFPLKTKITCCEVWRLFYWNLRHVPASAYFVCSPIFSQRFYSEMNRWPIFRSKEHWRHNQLFTIFVTNFKANLSLFYI